MLIGNRTQKDILCRETLEAPNQGLRVRVRVRVRAGVRVKVRLRTVIPCPSSLLEGTERHHNLILTLTITLTLTLTVGMECYLQRSSQGRACLV